MSDTNDHIDIDALFGALARGELSADARDEADALATLGLHAAPVAPSIDGLDALMGALDAKGPFEHLLGTVADLLAVTRDKARTILGRMDEPERWEPGPRPWIELLHLTGTVGVEGAVIGFVRIEAGKTFPHHHHFGDEYVLILQGGVTDGTVTLVEGDVGRMDPDTAHALQVLDGDQLIYLAVVYDGIEIDGAELRVGPPGGA